MITQNITPYNTNIQKQGYWEEYHSNGKPFYKGNYVNGKQHGYFEEYYNKTFLI